MVRKGHVREQDQATQELICLLLLLGSVVRDLGWVFFELPGISFYYVVFRSITRVPCKLAADLMYTSKLGNPYLLSYLILQHGIGFSISIFVNCPSTR